MNSPSQHPINPSNTRMEFEFSSYYGRAVLNPQDIILRVEHKTTARIYEQTFFERDFVEYASLGGLEFVGKLLSLAFGKSPPAAIKFQLEETPQKVTLTITHSNEIYITPLSITFALPAIRKQTGASDMEGIQRKFTEQLSALAAQITPLTEKIKELEERCGDSVVIPGVPFPIPVASQTVTLVKGNSQLPNGQAFTFLFPNAVFSCGNAAPPYTSPISILQTYPPQHSADIFVFSSLKSIKQLSFLKNCLNLTLSGCNEITDFSPIAEMTNLRNLTIVSSRQWNGSTFAHRDGNPPLKDISWIRNLKNLQTVSFLGCNQLVDITPLKDLPNLKELDIRETGVRNTDFLTNPRLKITK